MKESLGLEESTGAGKETVTAAFLKYCPSIYPEML
jgi:hypothetical protein